MQVSEKAVEAGAAALEKMYKGPGEDPFHLMAKNVLEAALPHLSHGAVSSDNEGLVKRLRNYAKHDGHSSDAHVLLCGAAHEAADLLSALSPAPVGVTDEVAKNSWRSNDDIAIELMDAASDADAEGRIADARFMRIAASRLEALASHEPAPTDADDELERVDADANAMAWGAELKSAKARTLELETDLEIANDRLRVANEALEPFSEVLSRYTFSEHQLILLSEDNPVGRRLNHLRPEDFGRARAVLGGQSNG